MTMFDWGLTAAAVLMLLFAIRAVTSSEGKERLGCGFGLVTALLWIWVLRHHLPDFDVVDAARVAIGILLVLPAARALKQPKGGVVMAAVALVLAFVIAGPVVARLWKDHKPDIARTKIERLEDRCRHAEPRQAHHPSVVDQLLARDLPLPHEPSEQRLLVCDHEGLPVPVRGADGGPPRGRGRGHVQDRKGDRGG